MPGPIKEPLEPRFWAKVNKTKTCWLWTASKTWDGYGRIGVHTPKQWDRAHRISWEIHFGPIPPGLYVLHRCDVRLCVNPDHLFLGTCAENLADMHEKGRSPRGARNGNAKLTEEAVTEIRRRRAAGESLASVATRFGIHQNHVTAITTRRRWAHV